MLDAEEEMEGGCNVKYYFQINLGRDSLNTESISFSHPKGSSDHIFTLWRYSPNQAGSTMSK